MSCTVCCIVYANIFHNENKLNVKVHYRIHKVWICGNRSRIYILYKTVITTNECLELTRGIQNGGGEVIKALIYYLPPLTTFSARL